ncbi:MAG: hypothetical protein M3228_14420 [Actinomycetota bacterium]|nr:hypothetical protein [Actinomycetota bacterium]
MDRRAFLVTEAAALAACSSPNTAGPAPVRVASPAEAVPDWEWVRAQQQEPYVAWMRDQPPGSTRATWVTPGGFKAYEHLWALPAAFAFHGQLGRT